MKKLKYIIFALVITSFQSCGGGGDSPEPVKPVLTPSAASLVFPLNNEGCNTGASVSETQSKVNFQWNVGANTSASEIVIKNLLSNAESKSTSASNQSEITILKNTPYKWWVISKATGTTETAKSPEWKFYNSGDAVTTFAPFPAELVGPTNGSTRTTATVTLEWKGSDVDSDLASYDVYFGTENPPTVFLISTEAPIQKTENVAVIPTTYYWRVVSVDGQGNTSGSHVFEFKVE